MSRQERIHNFANLISLPWHWPVHYAGFWCSQQQQTGTIPSASHWCLSGCTVQCAADFYDSLAHSCQCQILATNREFCEESSVAKGWGNCRCVYLCRNVNASSTCDPLNVINITYVGQLMAFWVSICLAVATCRTATFGTDWSSRDWVRAGIIVECEGCRFIIFNFETSSSWI